MSVKTIAIIVIALLIVGGGAYYFMQQAPAPVETPEAAAPTPQVAGQDAVVGEGATAAPNSQVEVLYVGMLQDGTVFDSSANNNNEPLAFVLGAEGIIPGFQIGVNGMKEGGERRISVPPELGYGSQDYVVDGKVIIPANSTLIFDIKLVKVTAGSTTPATN
jgi:FKBP-type peptidyl-prolyl cis-trans isomerase